MDDSIIDVNFNNYFNSQKIDLNIEKKICLVRIFENDEKFKKRYLRKLYILIEDILVTSNITNTTQFMEELNLFDTINNQNKYFDMKEHQKNKNLKLKDFDKKDIYISKSEAKSIYKIYNMSFSGYSLSRVLELEHQLDSIDIKKVLKSDRPFSAKALNI